MVIHTKWLFAPYSNCIDFVKEEDMNNAKSVPKCYIVL